MGSPGSAPPFHPCTRMRPPPSPQLLRSVGPNAGGGVGRRRKNEFCALRRKLGLLFPWKRGCESKARWVSMPHKARSEPLAFTRPWQPSPSPRHFGAGEAPAAGQGALTALEDRASVASLPSAPRAAPRSSPWAQELCAWGGYEAWKTPCPETIILRRFCPSMSRWMKARSLARRGLDETYSSLWLPKGCWSHLPPQRCAAVAGWSCTVQVGTSCTSARCWDQFESHKQPHPGDSPRDSLGVGSLSITPGGARGAQGLSTSPSGAV